MTDPHDRQADEDAAPTRMVGERYRLVQLVATNAAGDQFFSARDTVLPRDIAVTLIPNTNPSSDTVTHTLNVGRLGHDGLPQILDMGEAGTASYVAGPWTDGTTVLDLLADGPTEPIIAARVTAQIADALASVHAAGLALGTLSPSLVRVNTNGEIRLSHAVVRAGATPDDDVRALGALLYLMLTDTWPTAVGREDESRPVHKAEAVMQDGRPAPAEKVNHAVPTALAAVAHRALDGTLDAAGIATAIRQANGEAAGATRATTRQGAGAVAAHAGRSRTRATRRGEAQTSPASDRVKTDRRIKMSVAGAMLVVLAALMVIAGSSVTKQFLAALVAPINASSHEMIEPIAPPTTTRTVAGDDKSTSTLPGSSGTEPSSGTSSQQDTPITIAGATVYDPQGDGDKDYTSYVDRSFDGDPATFWLTWVYKQQFGPSGLKTGVGLMLHFDDAASPSSVTVATTTPGTKVEIRSADKKSPALDSTDVLGSATLDENPVNISLSDAPSSKYLLVWITTLAPYRADDGSIQNGFQSTISEITVTQ